MYCRRCSYRLTGLPECKCPECGRAFDPADPSSYEETPRTETRWRDRAVGIGSAAAICAVAWLGLRFTTGLSFGSYDTGLWSQVAIGLPLAITAGALAARNRTWPGRIALLLVGVLCLWLALLLGVAQGFRAWQSIPDPPDAAFADGGPMMGALLLGWLPATIVVMVAFAASWLFSRVRRRRRARTAAKP